MRSAVRDSYGSLEITPSKFVGSPTKESIFMNSATYGILSPLRVLSYCLVSVNIFSFAMVICAKNRKALGLDVNSLQLQVAKWMSLTIFDLTWVMKGGVRLKKSSVSWQVSSRLD